jgi:hypothetical protein
MYSKQCRWSNFLNIEFMLKLIEDITICPDRFLVPSIEKQSLFSFCCNAYIPKAKIDGFIFFASSCFKHMS